MKNTKTETMLTRLDSYRAHLAARLAHTEERVESLRAAWADHEEGVEPDARLERLGDVAERAKRRADRVAISLEAATALYYNLDRVVSR